MRTLLFLLTLAWSLTAQSKAFDLKLLQEFGSSYTVSQEQLLSLPQKVIVTELPWVEGQTEFSGVLIGDIFSLIKKEIPDTITLIALNDYQVSVPREDILEYSPIIAIKKNGQFMSVRDKGPYWLIFPLSEYKEIDTMYYREKMIWQIKEIFY
ncbi:hypothetical protein BCU68_13060 [Vibrio sp. 10N.286.49.B3]|uniref:hypothetical protein n=1 Tax=Vibrio sp. 10N.286.49.B3 TaxID=1880855 RepID=UPI000C83636A|nr:hypothetical protein [Vibrio sp. 10N.286.49.B3]PMH43774.1 hypothetical protein BCU68_13060 [Vibrio sp. 10N.286.49.B3]